MPTVKAVNDAMRQNFVRRTSIGDAAVNDAAVASGLAFLRGELEKRDPQLLEPLTNVSYFKDIDVVPGGGFVDYTSNNFVDYATTGGNQNGNSQGIQGGQTTGIPTVQANVSKDIYKVFTWMNNMKVSFIDNEKYQNAGATKSLDQMYNDGIKLNFNKALDQNAYQGFGNYGTYGLVNSPAVTAGSVAAGASSGKTLWKDKLPIEILTDVNAAITAAYMACEYDESAVSNHILIDPQNYAYIQIAPVTSAGTQSILEYLLQNNIAKTLGEGIFIRPSRWCLGAGAGGTQRMVVYRKEEKFVNFDLTVALTRIMTAPDVTQAAYITNFAGQLGQVKYLYPMTARYVDGI
jgi:hypothetical protein